MRWFKTERGLKAHQRVCWYNEESTRYTSGKWLPIRNERGELGGFCRNDPAAIESLRRVSGVLGLTGSIEHIRSASCPDTKRTRA